MKRPRAGVDFVAGVLAMGLALSVVLILIATIVQILTPTTPRTPEIQLSENATQILIAAIGGMVGVLGGYVGYRMHEHKHDDNEGSRGD